MKKPKGWQGSWFAEWRGEMIPCIHKHWTHGHWPQYRDPGVDERAEWGPFIRALQEGGRAILTTSEVPDGPGPWRRNGYVGLWSIRNVLVENGVLTFDLEEPLERFR